MTIADLKFTCILHCIGGVVYAVLIALSPWGMLWLFVTSK